MHLTLFSMSIARDKTQELEFWIMLLWKLLFLYVVREVLGGLSQQPHHVRQHQYFHAILLIVTYFHALCLSVCSLLI